MDDFNREYYNMKLTKDNILCTINSIEHVAPYDYEYEKDVVMWLHIKYSQGGVEYCEKYGYATDLYALAQKIKNEFDDTLQNSEGLKIIEVIQENLYEKTFVDKQFDWLKEDVLQALEDLCNVHDDEYLEVLHNTRNATSFKDLSGALKYKMGDGLYDDLTNMRDNGFAFLNMLDKIQKHYADEVKHKYDYA